MIAEAPFWHRVLVGEQPVVGAQLQLPGPRTDMADEGGPEATDITRIHLLQKKQPAVAPTARTGTPQRSRTPNRPAGLDECQGVLAPLLLVEVDRQEVAGVVVE